MARKKGLSIWEFVQRHKELSDYFKQKLRECIDSKSLSKEARERNDMVIFSILLLISRLIPAFQLTDSEQEESKETATL